MPVADVAPLLVAGALLGTGFMYLQMTAQNLVGVLADPTRRPAAFSVLALGFSTSGLIAPVSSGFMIDAFGHRVTFAAIFVLMAISLALLLTQRQATAVARYARQRSRRRPIRSNCCGTPKCGQC